MVGRNLRRAAAGGRRQVSIPPPTEAADGAPVRNRKALVRMTRLAGPLLICSLACWSATAYAQANAPPASAELSAPELQALELQVQDAASNEPTFAALAAEPAKPAAGPTSAEPPAAASAAQPTFAALRAEPSFAARPDLANRAQSPAERSAQTGKPPTADDICRTIEQSAAENGLPVEFFARVIWQESRFNAFAVSNKGAQGIAQFMPRTADARGLSRPVRSDRGAASFGGLFARADGSVRQSRACRGRLQCRPRARERLAFGQAHAAGRDPQLRRRHHRLDGRRMGVGLAAGEKRRRRFPQGVPCTRLANLILAPKEKAQQIAAYVPRWGAQLTSNWSESRAWETYRTLQRQYASLIGDREPIVLRGRLPGMGAVSRTIIRIGDDSRAPLDALCNKLIAAGGACVVLRNQFGRAKINARRARARRRAAFARQSAHRQPDFLKNSAKYSSP